MMRSILSAMAIGLTLSTAQAQTADTMTLIVNRSEDSATYYLSMPADGIEPVLAVDPALLFSDEGRVPIDQFRLTGSFDLADEMFTRITGSLEGQPFAFEAMSMMVHPISEPLPFAAPWDAYTAISVCTVPYTTDDLVPGVLQMYYGGFTDQVHGDAPLKIHFPQTGRDAMDIVVHRYDNGRLMSTEVQTLADGGALIIETGGRAPLPAWVRSFGVWLAFVGLTLGTIAIFRARHRGARARQLSTQP
ncbi:MAG: hypothetical protein AAGK79_08730 [Pseudomonadota bacterium]